MRGENYLSETLKRWELVATAQPWSVVARGGLVAAAALLLLALSLAVPSVAKVKVLGVECKGPVGFALLWVFLFIVADVFWPM